MSRNLFVTLFSEATTHNTSHDAHTTRTQTIPSSNAMSSKKARARKKKREKRERDAITSEAIPGLPDHLVVAHVLRSEQSDDPADLARLPAVSHAMRGAVAKTGLRFEQLGEWEAVNLGCLSAVKRLQRGGRLSRRERLCQAAARSGQLEELKVLRENGCPWNEDTCAYAAFGGQLEVLQWARANAGPWGASTCMWAAEHGHLEVLQWLRANGCPWNESTCTYAAKGGHLEVLQWLRANGCPWDKYTCTQAAHGGHPEVLQWAHANGCPWDAETSEYAASEGNRSACYGRRYHRDVLL